MIVHPKTTECVLSLEYWANSTSKSTDQQLQLDQHLLIYARPHRLQDPSIADTFLMASRVSTQVRTAWDADKKLT